VITGEPADSNGVTVNMALVVSLNHPTACDVAVSGAKGAGLAQAKAAGLPVPDGFVVSPAASLDALLLAESQMESRGTGGARMAIIGLELDAALSEAMAVAARCLNEPLIVRSSSILEGSGQWSGAFTSVPEVHRNELSKAAKSVWASCYALEVLERYEAAVIEPCEAPMGLVVQSEIFPDFGGAAVVYADSSVRIDAVAGSPRDLMAGWSSGCRAEVSDGEVSGRDALELMGADALLAVAAMAAEARQKLGFNLIEWVMLDSEPLLLQVQKSLVDGADESFSAPAALGHRFALDFVRMARDYPGSWGEELVLGWLPALRQPPEPVKPATEATAEELAAKAQALARRLLAQAWGEPPEEADAAHAKAMSVLRRMRSDRPNESIDALSSLAPVDPDLAAQLLGMTSRLLEMTRPSGRQGIDRWEPVLAGVAALQGEICTGRGSASGIGAGRLVWVEHSKQTEHVRPRDIIVTQYPLANFSPLLFDAAGIISVGGAPTAHLFEVARSLTVPAVVDCHGVEIVRNGPRLGMLDGDSGRVAILPEQRVIYERERTLGARDDGQP